MDAELEAQLRAAGYTDEQIEKEARYIEYVGRENQFLLDQTKGY